MKLKEYYLHAFYQNLIDFQEGNEGYDAMMMPLQSILEHGILSRKLLIRKKLDTIPGVRFSTVNLNDKNYVSLVQINQNTKFENFGNNSFSNISNYPVMIIDPIIKEELKFRRFGKRMVNEVQVRDRIDPKYFIGLRMPYHPYKCKNLTELNELKEKLIVLNNFVARYNITVYEQRTLKPILESINKK